MRTYHALRLEEAAAEELLLLLLARRMMNDVWSDRRMME